MCASQNVGVYLDDLINSLHITRYNPKPNIRGDSDLANCSTLKPFLEGRRSELEAHSRVWIYCSIFESKYFGPYKIQHIVLWTKFMLAS
jgi:hypothetical protein